MSLLNSLTIKQLRAVLAVAEEGSFSSAADRLNLTPPAVHTQVKGLEEQFGAALFARGPRNAMVLTEYGQVTARAARRILSQIEGLGQEVAARRDGMLGRVRIGVVSTGKYFGPQLVARLMQRAPEVKVEMIVGNRERIISALADLAIDIAVMGRPPRDPLVEAEIIGPHPHVLIAAPGHRLAGGVADSAELFAETLIVREEGSGTRILMTRFLDRIGDGRAYDPMILDSNETIKQAVMARLGIAMISRHTVMDELSSGRLIELPMSGLPIERQWYLIRPSGLEPSPCALRLWREILALKGDYLPAPV